MSNIIQIHITKEYDKFKKFKGNRDLCSLHLRTLISSIQSNNFLSSHPIIVDSNMYVIDGQHRLEAAKTVGVPIHYLIDDNFTEQNLIQSNVIVKKWGIENFLKLFADAKSNPVYIELQMMMKETKLSPRALLFLLKDHVNNDIMRSLKLGVIDHTTGNSDNYEIVEYYKKFMDYVKNKRVTPYMMFTNYFFTPAFRWLYKTDGFNKDKFFKKLDNKWYELKPQANSREWYRLLISIYNHKEGQKLEEQYGFEKEKEKKCEKKDHCMQIPLFSN